MVRAELGAGERDRANAIVARAKERCVPIWGQISMTITDDCSRAYPSAVVARINGVLWERTTSVDQAVSEELSAVTSGNESGSSSPPAQTPSSSSGTNSLP